MVAPGMRRNLGEVVEPEERADRENGQERESRRRGGREATPPAPSPRRAECGRARWDQPQNQITIAPSQAATPTRLELAGGRARPGERRRARGRREGRRPAGRRAPVAGASAGSASGSAAFQATASQASRPAASAAAAQAGQRLPLHRPARGCEQQHTGDSEREQAAGSARCRTQTTSIPPRRARGRSPTGDQVSVHDSPAPTCGKIRRPVPIEPSDL